MNILAVDDELSALRVLTQAIRDAIPDAEVTALQSGAAAKLHLAMHPETQVVFLDIHLRDTDGLTLGKELKRISPRIDTVFCTGYSQYGIEACNMQAKGYLLKPVTADNIRAILDSFMMPEQVRRRGVFAQTFGSFSLFADGKLVSFSRGKAQEMLAYLIDRRGSGVTRKELAAVILEDDTYSRATQSYLTQIIADACRTLRTVGYENLIVKSYNSYAINKDMLQCDLYDYENGDLSRFHGEYMTQYSWSELTLGELLR